MTSELFAGQVESNTSNWRSELSKVDVWYASFGSNMWQQRFLCYIQGGQVFSLRLWVKNANKWLIVFLHVFANWYSCIFIALFYINCLHLVDFFEMTLRWKGCKSHVLEQKIKHRQRRLRGSLSLIGYSLAVSLHKHGVLEGWLFSILKATAKKKFTYACTELRMSSFVAPFFGCPNILLQIMYHIPGPIILLICS